jgi:hypothetical protein
MRTVRNQQAKAVRPNEDRMIGDMMADPTKEYTLVEKPTTHVPGYRPNYSELKQIGYEKVSTDPNVTGHDELELWAAPKEKVAARHKDHVAEATASYANPMINGELVEIQEQGAMTLSQLQTAAQAAD